MQIVVIDVLSKIILESFILSVHYKTLACMLKALVKAK